MPCGVCKKEVLKTPGEIRVSKSGHIFCSRSCSATYKNTHKVSGTRRSKLEVWIEKELDKIYPNEGIMYNNKTAIESELDIYFPNQKIAFELNGIFHRDPIYGNEKLKKILENDAKKAKACVDNEIELYIIDVSNQKKFSPKTSIDYLNFIIQKIESFRTP
jgi:hypothetical protein